MKYYNITQVKESGAYFREDTVYFKIKITDAEQGTVSDPSSVSIEVLDPCGESHVSVTEMDKTAVGYYKYEFNIEEDAPFGLYDISIITSSESQIQKFQIVVFRWDICSRVRELSSAYQQNDISDYKLAIIAWHSFKEVLEEIYDLHYEERPSCNPDDGSWFDGINTTFQLKTKYLADYNGDGQITGDGELDCGYDVKFYYIDIDGNKQDGHVSVLDADNGLVSLLTSADGAVPNTMQKARVTYWERSKFYNEELMHEAVAYLTAYKIAMTFKALNKATLADIQMNRELDAEKFKLKYEELIGMIGFNAIGCGK